MQFFERPCRIPKIGFEAAGIERERSPFESGQDDTLGTAEGISKFDKTVVAESGEIDHRHVAIVKTIEDRLVHPCIFIYADAHLQYFETEFRNDGVNNVAKELLDSRVVDRSLFRRRT
jgi:hypothetical protein